MHAPAFRVEERGPDNLRGDCSAEVVDHHALADPL
jgi:hypothetical protein